MTYREDFFRMLDGKTPVSDVPFYFMDMTGTANCGYKMVMPERNDFVSVAMNGKNMWGVPYKIDDFGTGFMPAPGEFILKDVTKWKDIIKAPYDYDYDWAAAAERDMAMQAWDKDTQVGGMFAAGGSFFLSLAGFMGFEGAMLAMYDEPEALHELLDYLCDYDVWVFENLLKNYKDIDVMGLADDNATEINPFISYDMFKEFLLPRYKRLADLIKDNGKIVAYHNCGRCEDFMDDMVDIGVQIWNAATPVNDLLSFKEKHDNKIIIELATRFYISQTEEEVRAQVREMIDTYAVNGAFTWISDATTMNPELGAQLNSWIFDEVESYGKGFYQR